MDLYPDAPPTPTHSTCPPCPVARLVNKVLAAVMHKGGRETAAMVKLTVALTGLRGGVADNVLPQVRMCARACVHVRVLGFEQAFVFVRACVIVVAIRRGGARGR